MGGLKNYKGGGRCERGGGGEEEHQLLAPSKVQDPSVLPQPLKELSAFSYALPWVLHTAWGGGSEAVRGSGVS